MSAPSHASYPRVHADADKVEAVLVGGPLDLPTALRYRRANRTDSKIKIVHRGGYEHFERVDAHADAAIPRPLVFEWTTRTKPAE
jgi:hypothetical protein